MECQSVRYEPIVIRNDQQHESHTGIQTLVLQLSASLEFWKMLLPPRCSVDVMLVLLDMFIDVTCLALARRNVLKTGSVLHPDIGFVIFQKIKWEKF